jgi:hypothetical protein
MMSNVQITLSLSKLNKRTNEETLRYELFSAYTYVILSKEYFKKNIDIKPFLEGANIELKKYVYLSRTQLLSRVMRIIHHADDSELRSLLKNIKNLVFEKTYAYQEKESKIKEEKNSYFDSILDQFNRGEK